MNSASPDSSPKKKRGGRGLRTGRKKASKNGQRGSRLPMRHSGRRKAGEGKGERDQPIEGGLCQVRRPPRAKKKKRLRGRNPQRESPKAEKTLKKSSSRMTPQGGVVEGPPDRKKKKLEGGGRGNVAKRPVQKKLGNVLMAYVGMGGGGLFS